MDARVLGRVRLTIINSATLKIEMLDLYFIQINND